MIYIYIFFLPLFLVRQSTFWLHMALLCWDSMPFQLCCLLVENNSTKFCRSSVIHCQDSSDEEEREHDAVPTRAPVVAMEACNQSNLFHFHENVSL